MKLGSKNSKSEVGEGNTNTPRIKTKYKMSGFRSQDQICWRGIKMYNEDRWMSSNRRSSGLTDATDV